MALSEQYRLVDGPPTVDNYLALRRDAGLSPKSRAQGEGALAGSWSFCHVREVASDTAVAMGRVIGDGAWYFHIADMATLPAHQRQGLGRAVLEHLLDGIHEVAPDGPMINLIADPPGVPLYQALGFVSTIPSIGMVLHPSDAIPTGDS